MVLNNVSKFHKILIKSIRLRERTSLGQTYVHCHGGGIIRERDHGHMIKMVVITLKIFYGFWHEGPTRFVQIMIAMIL